MLRNCIVAQCPDDATARELAAKLNSQPDLLAALQGIESDLEHLDGADLRPAHQATLTSAREAVRAAIAKATS